MIQRKFSYIPFCLKDNSFICFSRMYFLSSSYFSGKSEHMISNTSALQTAVIPATKKCQFTLYLDHIDYWANNCLVYLSRTKFRTPIHCPPNTLVLPSLQVFVLCPDISVWTISRRGNSIFALGSCTARHLE